MRSYPLFANLPSLSLALILMLLAPLAPAQEARSGGGETQKFMQQYQQLAGEKTALQAQLTQMKHDLDAAQTELTSVKKDRDALKSHTGNSTATNAALAQLTADKAAAEKNLELSKQRLNDLVGRFRETATNLKEVEADRAKLQTDLKSRSTAYDKCAVDNAALYQINVDILNRYEHVGPFTKVSAVEPFTKITRARIDNLVDEYRARAAELKVDSKPASPPTVAH